MILLPDVEPAIERAARRLVEIRGYDPDEPMTAECQCGQPGCVGQVTYPQWRDAIGEIIGFMQVQAAIAHTAN